MKTDKIIVQAKKLEDMTDAEVNVAKYRSLENRYNSMVEAAQALSEQNELFRNEIETCYAKMENAQKNVEINQKIVMNTVLGQNKMKDDFTNEINILTSKLKKAQEALG